MFLLIILEKASNTKISFSFSTSVTVLNRVTAFALKAHGTALSQKLLELKKWKPLKEDRAQKNPCFSSFTGGWSAQWQRVDGHV